MYLRKVTCILTLLCTAIMAFAQVEIKVTYTDETGTEVTATALRRGDIIHIYRGGNQYGFPHRTAEQRGG